MIVSYRRRLCQHIVELSIACAAAGAITAHLGLPPAAGGIGGIVAGTLYVAFDPWCIVHREEPKAISTK